MSDPVPIPVRALSLDECWALLRIAPLGRIALSVGGELDIFPINFAVADRAILFRTAPGTKLLELTVHDRIALEIDGYDLFSAYSVVVKGRARELQTLAETDAADALGLSPWVPTPKFRWVRIDPDGVSGRSLPRAPDPAWL